MCEIIHTISNLSGKLQTWSKSVLLMMNQIFCCLYIVWLKLAIFSADTYIHTDIIIIYPLVVCQLEHYVLKVNYMHEACTSKKKKIVQITKTV